MKNKIIGKYRTFKHNLNYKEGYFNNLVGVLLVLLIIDLLMLLLVWR